MSMLTNLDLIRRVSLFAMLTPAQAETIANAVSKQRFKRGECLVAQGDISDALYIILSGRTRVLMTDSKGREVILATLRTGDYIGEMSLIDNEAHSATVTAEVQTDVLVLGREAFSRCLGENMSMAYAIMRGLVHRLRGADQKIGSLALMGVYGRVATVLLENAVPGENGEHLIRDKISRQDLAKMVGASREMVSRVMKDFEENGFIETLESGIICVHERRTKPR
jgi:CRP/FNR family transcriptional regulator, cyclic AMP receptor protein